MDSTKKVKKINPQKFFSSFFDYPSLLTGNGGLSVFLMLSVLSFFKEISVASSITLFFEEFKNKIKNSYRIKKIQD